MYKPEFTEQQTRVLLEGLSCMELYLQGLIKKTRDEDDRIDASNDLLYAASLRGHIEKEASKVFGASILIHIYPKDENPEEEKGKR